MFRFKCPKCGEVADILQHFEPTKDLRIIGVDRMCIIYGPDENEYDEEGAFKTVLLCGSCKEPIEGITCDIADFVKKHGVEVPDIP